MRILDGYLLREMAMPLLFGVIAFTSIFVGTDLVQVVQMVTEFGAPLSTVFRLFVLKLPQIAVWTFPMAVLLAALLSLSRLSANSEIVAMHAAGVSFLRVTMPVVAVGATMTLLTLATGEGLVPVTNAAYNRIVVEEVRRGELPRVTRNVILKEYQGGLLRGFLYAAEYDARTQMMRNVTLVSLEGGQPVQTTYAERVVWDGNTWHLENGVTHRYDVHGEWAVSHDFRGSRQPVAIGHRPEQIPRSQKNPEEMTIAELRDYVAILRSQGERPRRHEVQMHLKVAIPAACLIFALVGAPLGIQPHRSAASLGFGLSIVVIFVYYVIMTVGAALGQGGHLPPFLAAWLQNIILGALGVGLLVRAGHR